MSKRQDEAPTPAAQGEAATKRLHRALLDWYAASRRDLPWRRTQDPYAIWVSEIMCQQTRIDTVLPYYARFLERFPDVRTLAEAPADDVLAMWSGLGYYRRARMLQAGARAVVARGGTVPSTRAELLEVPGIGPYTSGAIASIAFDEPVGLVDGNVARVLARLFAIDDDMRKKGMRTAQRLADEIVAKEAPGAWNQALMELGSLVCTPVKPACHTCPVAGMCRARAEGRENELPYLSAKTKPEARRVQSLVLTRPNDGAMLLARRAPERLFGGLWEPPSVEGSAKERPSLAAAFGVERAERAGVVTHVLSHRKLTVDVLVAPLPASFRKTQAPPPGYDEGYDELRVVPRTSLDALGIATLAKKILRCAGAIAAGE